MQENNNEPQHISKEEFIANSENYRVYGVVKTLPGDLSYMKPGDKVSNKTLYDNGHNIAKAIQWGYIKSSDEPFDWQKELVGKNEHSVYSWCPECQSFGVNMPLDTKCGNCGYAKCTTFYDAQTIDSLITRIKLIPNEQR